MAMLFCEGFEQYADQADFLRSIWKTQFAGGITGFAAGRHGGQALQLHSANQSVAFPADGGVEYFIGVAVNFTGASVAAMPIIQLQALDIVQFAVNVTAAGELEVVADTQLDITSGLGLTFGIWYYIELHVLIDATVGEFEVKVNGATQLGPSTGEDTARVQGPNIHKIILQQNGTNQPTYDDFYLLDATGLTNNDFLGDIIVETVFPDGDGNRNDMTRVGGGLNNFEAVDDGATPDDDSTYNHGNVVGDDELYTFGDLTGSGFQIDTVHAVGVSNHFRSADAGLRTIKALARSNVTEVEGASQGSNASYRYSQHVYETDPDGGGAWDEAAVNAAEFGITIGT